MSETMICHVYKSLRKAGTYVYLRERDGFGAMPAEVAQALGELAFVLEVTLTPERKLAQEEAGVVMENLRSKGFHLQFPPPLDSRDA